MELKWVSFSALFILVSLSSGASTDQPIEVVMKSLSFDPKVLQIKAGQSVLWRNMAYTEHSATSDDTVKTFDTGLIKPGTKSREVTFKSSGQYHYHCSLHGKTMSGVIDVQAVSTK
jgi:plastocyanin